VGPVRSEATQGVVILLQVVAVIELTVHQPGGRAHVQGEEPLLQQACRASVAVVEGVDLHELQMQKGSVVEGFGGVQRGLCQFHHFVHQLVHQPGHLGGGRALIDLGAAHRVAAHHVHGTRAPFSRDPSLGSRDRRREHGMGSAQPGHGTCGDLRVAVGTHQILHLLHVACAPGTIGGRVDILLHAHPAAFDLAAGHSPGDGGPAGGIARADALPRQALQVLVQREALPPAVVREMVCCDQFHAMKIGRGVGICHTALVFAGGRTERRRGKA
jgi:hypothetical protein